MGEDLADIVATAAEHGEEGIADGALQGTSAEATVGFMWPISAVMALRRRRSGAEWGEGAVGASRPGGGRGY